MQYRRETNEHLVPINRQSAAIKHPHQKNTRANYREGIRLISIYSIYTFNSSKVHKFSQILINLSISIVFSITDKQPS